LLVEGDGVPTAVTVDGANRYDMKMAPKMLESVVIDRPEPTTRQRPQNMCMDKAYDFPEVRDLLEEYGYTPHIL
jgi:putative transposase